MSIVSNGDAWSFTGFVDLDNMGAPRHCGVGVDGRTAGGPGRALCGRRSLTGVLWHWRAGALSGVVGAGSGWCAVGVLPTRRTAARHARARLLAARVVSWVSCRGRAGAAQGGPPGARGSKLPLKAAPDSGAGEVAVLDPMRSRQGLGTPGPLASRQSLGTSGPLRSPCHLRSSGPPRSRANLHCR